MKMINVNHFHVPDAVQRVSGAPQSRNLRTFGARNDSGSAAQHHSARKTRANALMVLRCARETHQELRN
jgi:hypothetical protein